MNPSSAPILEKLLRTNGLSWMIDAYHPADQVLEGLLRLLQRTDAEFHRRFGRTVPFSPEQLAAEAERNSHEIKAFLQALGVSNSPEMLIMVWQILQGLTIRHVSVDYQEQVGFSFEVCLAPPGEREDAIEHYGSTDINDATLLRHFGVATINGKPLFEGFYPLRVKDDVSVGAEHVAT